MRCIHCGNQILATERACRHCGAQVVRLSVESTTGRGSSPRLIAVAAALFVVGIAAFMILRNRDALLTLLEEVSPASSEPAPPSVPAPEPAPATPPEPPTPTPTGPTPATQPIAEPATTPAAGADTAPAPETRRSATKARPAAAAEPGIPSAPEPPASPPARPVRVGGNIPTPTKIKDVRPVYPALAQQARVQGVVIIEATIAPDGSVTNARILRSIPLLDQAALDAVSQWMFTPTLLNGVPVAVIMTVTVQFTLQ